MVVEPMNPLKGSKQIYSGSSREEFCFPRVMFGQNPVHEDPLRFLGDGEKLVIVAVRNALHLLGSVGHRKRFPDH
jgi:hypothetical protein